MIKVKFMASINMIWLWIEMNWDIEGVLDLGDQFRVLHLGGTKNWENECHAKC